jgi:type IV secretion system protein VirB3
MQAEAIYKGATRPAMLLGIPLVPLVLILGLGALVALWGGILVSGWIAVGTASCLVPALLWMRWVASRDDQRLQQLFVAVRLGHRDRNRRFWGVRSYTPTSYKSAGQGSRNDRMA